MKNRKPNKSTLKFVRIIAFLLMIYLITYNIALTGAQGDFPPDAGLYQFIPTENEFATSLQEIRNGWIVVNYGTLYYYGDRPLEMDILVGCWFWYCNPARYSGDGTPQEIGVDRLHIQVNIRSIINVRTDNEQASNYAYSEYNSQVEGMKKWATYGANRHIEQEGALDSLGDEAYYMSTSEGHDQLDRLIQLVFRKNVYVVWMSVGGHVPDEYQRKSGETDASTPTLNDAIFIARLVEAKLPGGSGEVPPSTVTTVVSTVVTDGSTFMTSVVTAWTEAAGATPSSVVTDAVVPVAVAVTAILTSIGIAVNQGASLGDWRRNIGGTINKGMNLVRRSGKGSSTQLTLYEREGWRTMANRYKRIAKGIKEKDAEPPWEYASPRDVADTGTGKGAGATLHGIFYRLAEADAMLRAPGTGIVTRMHDYTMFDQSIEDKKAMAVQLWKKAEERMDEAIKTDDIERLKDVERIYDETWKEYASLFKPAPEIKKNIEAVDKWMKNTKYDLKESQDIIIEHSVKERKALR